ncbi:potassium channel family protein [Natroniella acetigena]|uniref:potassium channel family protein n=1 Tax=Natroniella acetigena TaxID=52004 RepID=UPI00200A2521|nr:potassium channel family protein [Natroniella acetigena]MCK8826445.1 potassium channel family protein [Natroniella acetigena]
MQLANLFLIYTISIISPTYLLTDLVKNHKKIKKNKKLKQKVIKRISNIYLSLTWLFFGLLLLWPYWSSRFPLLSRIAFFLIGYYAVSRVLEIFIVFLLDCNHKMKNKPQIKEGLSYFDRYNLALKAYLELILNYGLIFYALNTSYAQSLVAAGQNLFKPTFSNIFEAVYFSANTITIVGYGDIFPNHFLSQLFSIFQVLTGVFILIITFTVYVTLNFTSEQDLNQQKEKNQEIRQTTHTILQVLIIILVIIIGIIKINTWLK